MRVTRDECQCCPYKIRHEPFVVICHPCIRNLMAEREERAENRLPMDNDCICREGGNSNAGKE